MLTDPGADPGAWFRDPAQLFDIMPTVLDLTGSKYPAQLNGRDILPIAGVSLQPAFEGKPLARKSPIFIEHEANAFIREGDWKLVGPKAAPVSGLEKDQWELYQISKDGTELNNLAATHPDKVAELSAQWETWAKRVNVFPKGGVGNNPSDKNQNRQNNN